MSNYVDHACKLLGSQAQLATLCGVRRQAITYWLNKGRVPARHVVLVSTVTGIKAADLNPDFRDAH